MGHWYTKEAEPMHWIEGKNGKKRDTTLRDAKKLNLRPSVTTILNTIDKPALTNWKLKQVTNACYMEDAGTAISNTWEDYHKQMLNAAFEDSTAARDRGSEIHDAIEQLILTGGVLGGEYSDGVADIAGKALNAIMEYTEQDITDFITEATVCGEGYGGMVDLHSDEFLIDWKTKDIDDISKKLAYSEQAMQLAAYDKALPHTSANRRCINVFIDRTEAGKVVIYEWKPEDISLAWEKFQLLVKYWQLDKGYIPE